MVQLKHESTMAKSYLIIFDHMVDNLVQSKHERNIPKSYLIIFDDMVQSP